ncbi:phenazine biosynthesis protein PhzF family [Mariprofundus aestuarium]|uniref:Phenazine biosynthesis protein PhzF family n=1 Tax=Mariprofundus aestuarium TaxID=1921086 RepID=A0A2K8L027_MARES|nr:PhzF family phenazine biosynthesis protein [Mariprofundus aestuarium]ATX79539.1 phenazine biosynthesis protein PhzF family [Mariprofundus aestuarium]
MKLPIYQIDAFASKPFGGNPAAVCPLDEWLPDALMQLIAEENNLSETAFFVATDEGFHIRWFTPTSEVDLCGHATLAAAYVLFECLGSELDNIIFDSRSGYLQVTKEGELLVLDFPAQPAVPCETPIQIQHAFGIEPVECLKAEDYLVVFELEEDLLLADPNLELLRELDGRGVILTAPSDAYDFVSRFFAPKFGIDEDPVTGSSFTQLAPYWAARLGRSKLLAKQLSSRGGEVICELKGERVAIAGSAVKYLQGEIEV